MQLPPNEPMIVGLDEIHGSLEAFLEEVKFLQFEISTQEVQLDGPDLAFARGVYTWVAEPRQGGDPFSFDGKYLTIFQRQPDGSWKIYRDVFDSNLP